MTIAICCKNKGWGKTLHFQTYTYSFENHHCYDKGLNELCYRITTLPNNVFDFHQFLKEYSNIVYKLFLWHLYFLVADTKRFSIADFNELISFQWQRRPDIRQNGRHELNKLKGRIEQKLAQLRKNYPKANLSILEEKYQKMGLTPDTTYLFIRGHNIYDMVYMLNREVCKKVLRIAKEFVFRFTTTASCQPFRLPEQYWRSNWKRIYISGLIPPFAR